MHFVSSGKVSSYRTSFQSRIVILSILRPLFPQRSDALRQCFSGSVPLLRAWFHASPLDLLVVDPRKSTLKCSEEIFRH